MVDLPILGDVYEGKVRNPADDMSSGGRSHFFRQPVGAGRRGESARLWVLKVDWCLFSGGGFVKLTVM